jgi:hypothetical protein
VKFCAEPEISLAPRHISAPAFQVSEPANNMAAATASVIVSFCIAFLVDER